MAVMDHPNPRVCPVSSPQALNCQGFSPPLWPCRPDRKNRTSRQLPLPWSLLCPNQTAPCQNDETGRVCCVTARLSLQAGSNAGESKRSVFAPKASRVPHFCLQNAPIRFSGPEILCLRPTDPLYLDTACTSKAALWRNCGKAAPIRGPLPNPALLRVAILGLTGERKPYPIRTFLSWATPEDTTREHHEKNSSCYHNARRFGRLRCSRRCSYRRWPHGRDL